MHNSNDGDQLEVLITEDKIQENVRDLAREIQSDLPEDRTIYVVAILKGAFVFLSDLVRNLDCPTNIQFMRVSSYGGSKQSSGQIKILYDLEEAIEGEHVLLVEDIVDSGLTVQTLVDHLRAKSPASLRICTMLKKPDGNVPGVTLDYVGFELPDRFVVGYGLDYDEAYRGLPYVAALPESE